VAKIEIYLLHPQDVAAKQSQTEKLFELYRKISASTAGFTSAAGNFV